MNNILLVSSAGGHLSELKMISKIEGYNFIYAVECKNKITDSVINYRLISGSRQSKFKYMFVILILFFQALFIIIKTRPKIIISTGAHTCFWFFVIAKVFKIKTIYIESSAKVTNSSLTYKIIKKFCTKVIVQHKTMLDIYKGSIYYGSIY